MLSASRLVYSRDRRSFFFTRTNFLSKNRIGFPEYKIEDKFETCVRSSGFKCNWTSFFQDFHSCGDFLLFPELCLRSASHNSTHFTSIRPSGKEDW